MWFESAGKKDNSGNIRYFQDYSEQDSSEHKHFDTLPSGAGKKIVGDNFLEIPGAKIALQRSTELLDLVKNHCPWYSSDLIYNFRCSESIYSFLDSTVFAFDESGVDADISTHSQPSILKKVDPSGSVQDQLLYGN